MPAATPAPFGRLLTAMVTPFDEHLRVDLAATARLAAYLVDQQGCDAVVLNGTTGEAPTTSDAEKTEILRAVVDAVGDRAQVIAGVGTFSTEHTVTLARAAAQAGVDGLLVVTPYYSRPSQQAIEQHFLTVAEATELPIMLYDIPHRSGVPIEQETLRSLAAHPRILAVKDAKLDLAAAGELIGSTELAFYSGDDIMTLPLLAVGGSGLVGTSTHFTGALAKQMIETFQAGDPAGALELHRRLAPVFTGVFATQGCTMVKAGLSALGLNAGGLRAPMIEANDEQRAALLAALRGAGLADPIGQIGNGDSVELEQAEPGER